MRSIIMKNSLMFFCILSIILLVGCVDYQKILEEKESQIVEEQNLRPVILGDLNGDGKEEKVAVEILSSDEVYLKVYSGLKVVEKFKLEEGYDYVSLKAQVVNVDNDEKNEIVALISTGTRDVKVVKIINQTEAGDFQLLDFPEKIESNETYSGFGVNVTALEDFSYMVEKDDFKVKVDVGRLYYLSMRDTEAYEKISEVWNKIVASDFHGESLGVTDIYVLNNGNGEIVLDVYETIVGGDDKIIGYLITEINYNSDGTYSVERISFKERVDVMP